MMAEYAWPTRRNRGRPKATYELNVYLVPEDPHALVPASRTRVVEWLVEEKIAGRYYDRSLGWLAPGEQSSALFTDAPPDTPAFEYLIPYLGPSAQFVPNAHTGSFGSRCGRCGGELDEALHEFLQGPGTEDAATHALRCSCGQETPVRNLACTIDTAVTPFYLNFCHVDSGELRPQAREAIEALLGSRVRVIRELL